MGRKRVFHTVRIESIENKIALWELLSYHEMAHGLREFFGGIITEGEIEKHKASFAKSSPDLSYEPKTLEEPTKKSRKNGTFREVRTIKNRSGDGGKSYEWEYEITYRDGEYIGSKSIGRAK